MQRSRFFSVLRSTGSSFKSKRSDGSDVLGGWLWSIPVVTLGLGTWQVYRLDWKLDLIEKAKKRLYEPPIPLSSLRISDSSTTKEDLQFTRVSCRGIFLHDKEILVGPRTRSDQDLNSSGGLFGSGNPVGYFVFTPFKVQDPGETILVNRGWIPRDVRDQRKRQEGLIQGVVDIEGILRKGERSSSLMVPNNPEKNEWYSINTKEMAKSTGASTTLVELVADSEMNQKYSIPGSTPILRNPRINLPNNHLQYAIVWYGLCAFSTLALLRGRSKKRGRLSNWPSA